MYKHNVQVYAKALDVFLRKPLSSGNQEGGSKTRRTTGLGRTGMTVRVFN